MKFGDEPVKYDPLDESGKLDAHTLRVIYLWGEGNRVVLPHELVEAIRRASDNLITQALKERGQAAAATRAKKQQGG